MALLSRNDHFTTDALLAHMHTSSGLNDTTKLRPKVDIVETAEQLTIIAELPGVHKQDIAIELQDGVLKLTATRAMRQTTGLTRTLLHERELGSYQRSFLLGDSVLPHSVSATFADGLLIIVATKNGNVRLTRTMLLCN